MDVRRRCDGVPDCTDRSDEDSTMCGKILNDNVWQDIRYIAQCVVRYLPVMTVCGKIPGT